MNRLDDPELLLCSHRDQIGEASLCHHPCRHQYGGNEAHVLVADAARATSAAPTYFSHVDILGKFLVDGGYGQTNNPSYATWQHYFEWSPRANYGRVNLVNLGTGSKPKGHKGNKGWFDYFPNTLLPGFVKTMKTLAALATDSEQAARHMRSIEKAGDKLKFSRFSANTGGIHAIALHEYERMDEIVASTNEYLQDEVVLADLTRVANELVEAWRVRQPLKTTPTTRIATAHLQAATEPILRPSHEIAAPNQPHSAAGSMPGLAQSYVASDDTAYAIQPLHMNDTNIFSESANFKTPYHDPMRMLSPDWQVLSGQENSPELSQQPLCTTWRDGGHLEPPENTPDVTPEPSRSSSRSRYEFGTAYKEIMPGRHVEENPQPEADA